MRLFQLVDTTDEIKAEFNNKYYGLDYLSSGVNSREASNYDIEIHHSFLNLQEDCATLKEKATDTTSNNGLPKLYFTHFNLNHEGVSLEAKPSSDNSSNLLTLLHESKEESSLDQANHDTLNEIDILIKSTKPNLKRKRTNRCARMSTGGPRRRIAREPEIDTIFIDVECPFKNA